MEYLLIVVLGAVCTWLWHKLETLRSDHALLEERLVGLEQRLHSQIERPASTEAATPPVETPAVRHADDPARGTGTSPEVPPAAPDTRRPAVSQAVGQAEFEAVSDEDTRSGGFDFEELFGRRLPIWAGGITLAVGGIFLVRIAIESGLMTPLVRVAASFVFGLILLTAAEAAHRFEARLADPRVRQALAGAGLATLYAAFYLAGSVYGLIGPGAAFVGLAVVTAAALGLASRFGLPTALLGLVGGFATPAMVASNDPNLPLLSFYLALLAAGIAFTGRRMGAAWLGMIALLGGFGWGAVILAAVPVERADLLASGIFLVALGAAVPALASDRTRSAAWAQTAAAALASIQLAVLMLLNDFDLLGWGLYLLLLIALAALGWREMAIRRGGHFAAAVGIALLVPWAPDASLFAPVAAALAVVCAGGPLALAWLRRADEGDLWQGAAVPAAISAIAVLHFHSGEGIQPALATGLLALGALGTAGLLLAERTGGGARFAWGYGGGIALIAYLLFLALVPEAAMGWCLAAAGGAILLAQSARYHTALVLLAIALGWAVPPLVVWLTATLPAVYGSPASAAELPALAQVAERMVPVLLLGVLAAWRAHGAERRIRVTAGSVALFLAVIAMHVAYRQAFPTSDVDGFVAYGLVERTLWQAILLGLGAALAWHGRTRSRAWALWSGRALVGLSLVHFLWFGFVLHNPLWDAQAVGPWPLANLLVPSYAIGAIAWFAGRELERAGQPWGRLAGDVAIMVLALAFALSELRQAFAGSVLVDTPIGQGEDLLRSVLGIAVALAFLGWGWWRGQRRWRVGSLALMLLAVAKVFLIDAAGLEGLLRVASFLALGFSLIGIGWVYSRLLRTT